MSRKRVQTILKRYSLRDYAVPDHMVARSVDLFGERLLPDEAVKRIIRSVRDRRRCRTVRVESQNRSGGDRGFACQRLRDEGGA